MIIGPSVSVIVYFGRKASNTIILELKPDSGRDTLMYILPYTSIEVFLLNLSGV